MRHVTLITTGDDYDSAPGFMVRGSRMADDFMADREGVLIAHDLLEHVNGVHNIGSVWDELEALGGIWQVRARHGELFTGRATYGNLKAYDMPYQIASDITRMFGAWCYPESHYAGPGSFRAGSRPLDEETESSFAATLDYARKDIPNEHSDIEPERESAFRASLDSYLALALRRMRIGYRKAHKRYGDGWRGANQFVAIREAVASAAKQIETSGQDFRLSYGNGEARVVDMFGESFS